VDFLEREMLQLPSPLLWPSNSPGLNPVDHSVWSILQEKVYKTHITDLDDHTHRIRTAWAKLDHAVIAAAVRQWRRRLSACVRADCGRFEHCHLFYHCVFAITAVRPFCSLEESNS